jgi:cell division inhibitor SepF
VCYSLDGSMEKVATGVYLLKPAPQRVQRFDDYEA